MSNNGAPIKDNPSAKKLKDEMNSMSILLGIGKLFGIQLNDDIPSIKEMKKQIDELTKLPDEFNAFFAKEGWIAYESFHVYTMQKAVDLMKQGNTEAAENEILNYYRALNNIRMIISRGGSVKAFVSRKQLALYALDEYESARYYACVPLLLMIIDGVVNDISKKAGFFAEITDVISWDSIAGHYTGLTQLKNIYNSGRTKTNIEEIRMPFRNGILHGRDLNYNNIYVAAKCWGCLAAVLDWGRDIANGKKTDPPPEPQKSIKETWNELKDICNSFQKRKQARKELYEKDKKWTPREINVCAISIKNISSDFLSDLSPEKKVVEFFELWQRKNYGFMADRTWYDPKYESKSARIKDMRKIFENKKPLEYKIVDVKDIAPIISEIYTDVTIEYNEQQFQKQLKFRMIYEGENIIHGDAGGQWTIVNGHFELEYLGSTQQVENG